MGVLKSTFEEVSCDPIFQSRMLVLGLDFDLMDLWQFLEAEAASVGSLEGFTLEHILTGYVSFRDPVRHAGDTTVHFITDLFSNCETDARGGIDLNELLQLIEEPGTLQQLQKMGFVSDGNQEQLTRDLHMLFFQVEEDTTQVLTVSDIVKWFVEVREMVRQRELEDRVKRINKVSGSKSMKLTRSKTKSLARTASPNVGMDATRTDPDGSGSGAAVVRKKSTTSNRLQT